MRFDFVIVKWWGIKSQYWYFLEYSKGDPGSQPSGAGIWMARMMSCVLKKWWAVSTPLSATTSKNLTPEWHWKAWPSCVIQMPILDGCDPESSLLYYFFCTKIDDYLSSTASVITVIWSEHLDDQDDDQRVHFFGDDTLMILEHMVIILHHPDAPSGLLLHK